MKTDLPHSPRLKLLHSLAEYELPFCTNTGQVIAIVLLTPTRDAESNFSGPIVEVDEADAREYGETLIQLREGERYTYSLVSLITGQSLGLRCSLARRSRRLSDSKGSTEEFGIIETGSYCGTLLMELVEEGAGIGPIATALVDVRSSKLDYRSEYRGMLRRLSNEIGSLAIDCRQSTKVRLRSSFTQMNPSCLQIQLELLREVLDSSSFSSTMHRIIAFPNERMSAFSESVSTDNPIRWNSSTLRQLVSNHPRRGVPEAHPLRLNSGLSSVSGHVNVVRKYRDLDTPENRFIKHVLMEFRAFLEHARTIFAMNPAWDVSVRLTQRLSGSIEGWLGRSFFSQLGQMRFAPIGSPVLQRKAGYREVLQWWFRFRTATELSWKGGEDLFYAGQRNVATLYEYWLFFEILQWYCRKCRGGVKPDISDLVDGLEDGSPNLRLKQRTELGPFQGIVVGAGRKLNSRFSYNRRFGVTKNRREPGSWSRALHPDYTLSFWPFELSEERAEELELLVHIHFDAKYRVENIEELFGDLDSDDADEIVESNYKRQDLLKMHAYRDAIKRSQGAYVIYPGRSNRSEVLSGFHEILPGLGAFAISPDETGSAQGIVALEKFLDEVLEHLSNRTTAQDRISYHISEAYAVNEPLVPYGDLTLPELDSYVNVNRTLPLAEHMVLLAWYNNEAQRQLALSDDGLVYVRLGSRRGALHVHPNLSATRHVLLRTEGSIVNPGLLILREPGFRVYTRLELRLILREKGKTGVAAWEEIISEDDTEIIYAVFRTKLDPVYQNLSWNGHKLIGLIKEFESNLRNRLVEFVGRSSSYPRVLPLKDLLKAIRN